MNCAYSRDVLALYVEGDLADTPAADVRSHLIACEQCRSFCDDLGDSQLVLKSLRGQTLNANGIDICPGVMSRIENTADALGAWLRFERFVVLLFRRQRYAFALAALVLVAASLLSQIHAGGPADLRTSIPGLSNYREWVELEPAAHHSEHGIARAYINPSAYRTFVSTGKFPEGSVILLETSRNELQVSMKDTSKFEGGWGYFSFTADGGRLNATCRTCHEEHAETDQVFTQYYPMLKVTRS